MYEKYSLSTVHIILLKYIVSKNNSHFKYQQNNMIAHFMIGNDIYIMNII